MNIEWKKITYKGYDIMVSSEGDLRTIDRTITYSDGRTFTYKGEPLKIYKDRGGYCITSVHYKGKQINIKVHRAVAMAFLPNPENLPQVNHKDEDKTNNSVYNLEWCSAKYNSNYGTRTYKQSMKVGRPIICNETGIIYKNALEAQRIIGKPKSTHIRDCCNGRYKTAYGLTWSYINNNI